MRLTKIKSIVVAAVSTLMALHHAALHAQSGETETLAGQVPGKLFVVNDTTMHLNCKGNRDAGAPVAILDAGLGTPGLEWRQVQNALNESGVASCYYDRKGMGWSEATLAPQTSANMVENLHTLLQTANVSPPYLMVGQSFGGYNAQLFAQRYPDLTAGVVLVDSSHAEQIERYAQPPIRLNLVPTRPGLVFLRPTEPHPNVPGEDRDTMRALTHKQESILAAMRELAGFRESAHQVAAGNMLRHIPLAVISRGVAVFPRDPEGLKESLWTQLQQELASMSDLTLQIVARDSGHHVHLDQPEVVVEAVRFIVSETSDYACIGCLQSEKGFDVVASTFADSPSDIVAAVAF